MATGYKKRVVSEYWVCNEPAHRHKYSWSAWKCMGAGPAKLIQTIQTTYGRDPTKPYDHMSCYNEKSERRRKAGE